MSLACNVFLVPFVKNKRTQVSFVAGQPLGYSSSWPLFTLSHHILIWWCAEQVYPGIHLTNYAVLGDDVVIADPQVGKGGVLGQLRSWYLLSERTHIWLWGCWVCKTVLRSRHGTGFLPCVCYKSIKLPLYSMNNKYPFRRLSTYLSKGRGSWLSSLEQILT